MDYSNQLSGKYFAAGSGTIDSNILPVKLYCGGE